MSNIFTAALSGTELEFEHRLFNAKAQCWLPEASRRWDLSSALQRLSGNVGVKWDSDTEQAEVTAWASLEGIRQTGIWGQDVFLEHRAHFSGKVFQNRAQGS